MKIFSLVPLATFLCGAAMAFSFGLPSASAQTVYVTGNNTLNVNGNYFDIQAQDNSTVNGYSGNVSEMSATGTSTITNYGCTIGTFVVYGTGNTIAIKGGSVNALAIYTSTTVFNMTAGSVTTLDLESDASATVSGGTGTNIDTGTGPLTLNGGTFQNVYSFLSGNTNIYGSSFIVTNSYASTYTVNNYVYNGFYYALTGTLQNNAGPTSMTLFDAITQTNTTTGKTIQTPGQFILHDSSTGTITTLGGNAAPEPFTLWEVCLGIPVAFLLRQRIRKVAG